LLEVLPSDVERRDRLFQMALQGRALEHADFHAPRLALDEDQGKSRAARAKTGRDLAEKAAESVEPAAHEEEELSLQREEKAAAAPESLAETMPADKAKDGERKARSEDAARKALPEGKEVSGKEIERRRSVRQLLKPLERTQELAESNYYRLPIEKQ